MIEGCEDCEHDWYGVCPMHEAEGIDLAKLEDGR